MGVAIADVVASRYRNLMARYQMVRSELDRVRGIRPIVRSSEQALGRLKDGCTSMSRLGDGEFLIIFGRGIRYQSYDAKLAMRLREVLRSNVEDHIVCVRDVFGDEPGWTADHRTYWVKHLALYRHRYLQSMDLGKVYYEASATRIFSRLGDRKLALQEYEEWRKLWEGKDVVFIEGAATKMGVGNDLFSNTKSIKRIVGPATNAYAYYDSLLKAAVRQDESSLFLLALGPAATVLAHDLARRGIRALDVGHIDVEYEWMRMGATNVVVEGKYVNEAQGGDVVTECRTDDDYDQQVVFRCE